jgi:hypothetical protein
VASAPLLSSVAAPLRHRPSRVELFGLAKEVYTVEAGMPEHRVPLGQAAYHVNVSRHWVGKTPRSPAMHRPRGRGNGGIYATGLMGVGRLWLELILRALVDDLAVIQV